MRNSALKEGEWLACISQGEEETCEYIISFSLREAPRGPAIFIGGLQGPKGSDARERVRFITRMLYGVRPKDLLLSVVRAICQAINGATIEIVDSQHHIYRDPRKKKTIGFDYDEFAIDENGIHTGRGSWSLPLHRTPKPIHEVPSKRRKEYQRKYMVLDQIAQEIQLKIGGFVGKL